MKKISLLLNIILLFVCSNVSAQKSFNVITTSSFTYDPVETNISVGDTVKFAASGFHPLVEVTEAVYNGSDFPVVAKPKGFGCTSNCPIKFTQAGIYFFKCENHGSGGMKGKIIVSDPLGIQNSEMVAGDFKIYPIPTESNVAIDLSQNLFVNSISVINSQGVEVLSTSINSSIDLYNLNLKNLEAGLYQIVVSTSTKKLYSKVVVK